MRLSLRGLAFAAALLWGGAILFVGLINLAAPSYGAPFLTFLASIYPGYHFTRGVGDLLVGTLYALFDGGVAGLLFGWLYNAFAAPGA
jgi:hypothetical protein